MTPNATAKHEILSRVRSAIGPLPREREQDYAAIARAYVGSGALDNAQRLHLFEDRLNDYNAGVFRCSEGDLRDTIGRALQARGKRRLLIPADIPEEWLPRALCEFVVDNGFSYAEIDRSEGVLTGCAIAVALSGTIILQHPFRCGRRALTLIPDYHLCVVHESQVTEVLPEGLREIAGGKTAALTTISGPSATSDIEMTRVKGVHGPRTLDVVLVTG